MFSSKLRTIEIRHYWTTAYKELVTQIKVIRNCSAQIQILKCLSQIYINISFDSKTPSLCFVLTVSKVSIVNKCIIEKILI